MALSLADAEVLQGESLRGGGNRVYRFTVDGESRILKVYLLRRDRWRTPFRAFGSWLEGKRGVTAQARHETERETLGCWREHGFDVPKVYDDPLPQDVDTPALWMEDCSGPVVQDLLFDPEPGAQAVLDIVSRFAASLAERQRVAKRERELLLVHEHASFGHVLVHGDRLVSFDLEGGYRGGFSIDQALELEIAGLARSVVRSRAANQADVFDAFVAGYGDLEQLAGIVDGALRVRGVRRRLKRVRQHLRRIFLRRASKRDALKTLRTAIDRAHG